MILEKLVIPIGFDMGLLLEGVKAIEGLISGAIERTQQWAADMDALGDVTGMTTDKLAAWQFVVKKAGVDGDTFTNSITIMSKGLLDSEGNLSTTGKALQNFGVDILDANGKIRDQSLLMDDIAKKYASFGTQTERIDFLTNVFGKSGAKLVDVFDTLAKEGGIDQVKRKVESLGLVLDPGQYEDFQRNLNEVDLTFTGLANAFTGPLLPGAERLLQTFTNFLQSPWVADGIRNIGEGFGQLIENVSNMDWSIMLDPVRLTQAFQDWVASVDWGNISTTFAEQINNVDWAGITKDTIQSTANILEAFIDLIQRTNWESLGQAVKDALYDVFVFGIGESIGLAWEGAAIQFWIMVDNVVAGVRSRIESALNFGSGYTPYPGMPTPSRPSGNGYIPGRASGGSANGLTWVGERGPELVNLPNGSQVNNAQASANMGIDYYKLASILAAEVAKVTG